MKTCMPLDGFRWSCDSDSALCDIPQTNVFGRTGGVSSGSMGIVCKDYNIIAKNPFATFLFQLNKS